MFVGVSLALVTFWGWGGGGGEGVCLFEIKTCLQKKLSETRMSHETQGQIYLLNHHEC